MGFRVLLEPNAANWEAAWEFYTVVCFCLDCVPGSSWPGFYGNTLKEFPKKNDNSILFCSLSLRCVSPEQAKVVASVHASISGSSASSTSSTPEVRPLTTLLGETAPALRLSRNTPSQVRNSPVTEAQHCVLTLFTSAVIISYVCSPVFILQMYLRKHLIKD